MRIGKPCSKSYQRYAARKHQRKVQAIARLCHRLDRLVERAERLKTGRTRAGLLAQADRVREKLRVLDH